MVSVCMATYNGEKVVSRQLESILKQLQKNDEVVITDDCSTDDTVKEIKKINDKRILLYVNKTNKGVNKTFENSLSHASGNFIFLSDQDDIWKENKIEKVLNYFDTHKDVDIVQHDAIVVDEKNEIINESFFRWRKYTTPNVFVNFIRDTHLGCCMAFRKSVLNDCLPISKIPYHDKWIGIIAPILGHKMCYINDKLIYYVRCEKSTTSKILKRRTMKKIVQEKFIYVWEIINFIYEKRLKK